MGVLASAVFMDKPLAKKFFKGLDIPVLDDVVLFRPGGDIYNISDIIQSVSLPFPVCAKPANLGSSIGVAKAKILNLKKR